MVSTSSVKRRGVPWMRVALLASSTLVALVLAEVGLRACGFSYRLYPSRIEFGYPNPIELASLFQPHDRLLWVKPDHEEKLRRARERRPPLVFMGCSCTDWGRYDDAFVRRIAERHDGAQVDFVNLGTAGWSTYQGLEQMRSEVSDIAPRIVTIFFGWNDHWIGFGVDDATAAHLNRSPLFALQNLRLVQAFDKWRVAQQGESHEVDEVIRVSPEDFQDNLRQMVDLARGFGAVPVLLTAPTSHRVGHEPPFLAKRWVRKLEDLVPTHKRYVEMVREVAAEKQVPLCDLFAVFERMDSSEIGAMFKADSIHFSERGVEVVGEELYRLFDEQGLLDLLLPGAG